MLASPSDQPRADSLKRSRFLPSLLGNMAIFDKTEMLFELIIHNVYIYMTVICVKMYAFWVVVKNKILLVKKARSHAGRRINFAPVKSLDFSDSDSEFSLFEFRFTVFCPLGCGVDSWTPPFSFFKPRKEKPPKRHLSGCGINITILHPH